MGTELDRRGELLNASLVWAFLHGKAKSIASSWKEAVDVGTLDVADPAQGEAPGESPV